MLEVDRLTVQVVLRERDDKGDVVNEYPQQPQTVFGIDGLRRYQRELVRRMAKENDKQ